MFQSALRQPFVLRSAAFIVHRLGIPLLKVRGTVLVFSWRLVSEVLARDNDFRVAPINGEKMRRVAGDFFLGMDRQLAAYHQRDCGLRALTAACSGIDAAIAAEAERRIAVAGRTVDVIGGYARPVACATARRIFGIRAPSDAELMQATRAVFHETFLNPKDRDRAVVELGRVQGARLRRWILDEIEARRTAPVGGADFLDMLMARGDIDDAERATILAGYLVGAIDTTTTAFGYIAREIVGDPMLLRKVQRDIDRPERLLGWCLEVLRRRPQAPFLIRRTTAAVELAGHALPPDTLVLAITSAAHFDPNAYPAPDRMDPERPRENYFHFGAGPHHCSGRDVNARQLPILLRAFLAREPRSVGRLDYDGPFPDQLIVTFRE